MKVMIATGGSGGHIFPALHVALVLKDQGGDVYFAGAFGSMRGKIEDQGFSLTELPAIGLSTRSPVAVIRFAGLMTAAVWQAFWMLNKVRPDVVIGFGGYGAFPVVFAAALCRYPTMIHEQNVSPGRANAILARMVKRVAISFDQSRSYFQPGRTVLTGCPCHRANGTGNRTQSLDRFGLQERFTILVLGGSQGSQRINSALLEAAALLKPDLDFQVIHIAGKNDGPDLKQGYEQLQVPCRLYSFLDDVDQAYQAADLVISRAGAVTVTEIAAFRVPAILIPYPFAGGHQRENALVLVKKGAATLIEENDLSAERLKEAVLVYARQMPDTQQMQKAVQGICQPDAAGRLAQEVMNLRG